MTGQLPTISRLDIPTCYFEHFSGSSVMCRLKAVLHSIFTPLKFSTAFQIIDFKKPFTALFCHHKMKSNLLNYFVQTLLLAFRHAHTVMQKYCFKFCKM